MNSCKTASSVEAFAATLAVPFGAFGIRVAGGVIHELVFLAPDTPATPPACTVAERAATQIYAWLEDPDRPFDLPLAARGTVFQRRVWDAIAAIPRGETRRYAHLSNALGSAARAVGQACRANPFPLVIPCHRVVSATGIGGFAGASGGYLIDAKHWLLAFEANR
ncbi:methylated-DNA--[protein]-cysteine S-methyltransferase [Aromatoleum anaerobium]|uniref:Methylated-DNA--[protein]-cysteine S-methyltransferase n=1 Tax=Aromatoleum anaerobium TaxID=182180 RepID=A0ABX1PMY2_9RHOO|nr:methylated-DNA--[protein]-cysteine S-methyltransferase [Aromatoleum anaerobium]MCK0505498.1 methylated-DNA--[protein]-cysteine S-methyltransferase [Aromatoleum anaerobium]